MRTLVVAPDVDLAMTQVEAREVSQALGATLLNGEVRVDDVLDALDRRRFDAIWFASHGTEEGVLLSDGVLTVAELGPLARSAEASLLVLNTCESDLVAYRLFYELGMSVDLVATVGKIRDRMGRIFGTLLARALAEGASYQEAFERSRQGQRQLHLRSVRSWDRGQIADLRELVQSSTAALAARLDEIDVKFDRRIDEVEVKVEAKISGIENVYHARFDGRMGRLWLAGFVLFVLFVLMMISDIRHAIGISPVAAALFAVVLLPGSAFMFVSGLGFTFGRQDG